MTVLLLWYARHSQLPLHQLSHQTHAELLLPLRHPHRHRWFSWMHAISWCRYELALRPALELGLRRPALEVALRPSLELALQPVLELGLRPALEQHCDCLGPVLSLYRLRLHEQVRPNLTCSGLAPPDEGNARDVAGDGVCELLCPVVTRLHFDQLRLVPYEQR